MLKHRKNVQALPLISTSVGVVRRNVFSTATCEKAAKVMILWVFLGSFSMVTRCIAVHQSNRIRELLPLPFFVGILQDSVMIFQALSIMWCAQVIMIYFRGNQLSLIPSTFAMIFCNLVPFVDMLIQLKNCPRVDIGFIINLWYNFHIFYPSLKQAASSWICVSLLLSWVAFILLGSSYLLRNQRMPFEPKSAMLIYAINYIGWAICTASYQMLDPSTMYHIENAIFKLQHETFRSSITASMAVTKNEVKNTTRPTEMYTMPDLDISNLLDKSYPTLRKTHGFRGQKLFDINTQDEDPNILIIMMESYKDLRYLGKDARRIITPEFDNLCKSGIHFDNHYTPNVRTSSSLMSTLFGNLPETLVEPAIKAYPDLNLVGLPTLTKQKGYHNVFISAVDLHWDNWDLQLPRWGFDQLEHWRAINKLLRDRNYPPVETEHEGNFGLWDEKGFDGLYEHMKDFKANGTKTFVNFYSISTHWPFLVKNNWTIPQGIKQFAQNDEDYNYLATIAYSDEHLGRFIKKCRKEGLLDNTIVFIQGDHGGPSPTFLVPNGVHEQITHTPALLLADDLLSQGQRGMSISQVSSQADTFATFADIIGIPKGGILNHGIGSSMMREDPNKIVYFQNSFKTKTIGCRQRDIKISQEGDAPAQVFNMTADPLGENPLTEYNQKQAAILTEKARHVIGMYSSLYSSNQFVPRGLSDTSLILKNEY